MAKKTIKNKPIIKKSTTKKKSARKQTAVMPRFKPDPMYDADTLMRSEEIRMNPKRYSAAKTAASRLAKEKSQEASAAKRIAKR